MEKDKTLKRIVDLCYEMLELADHGDKFRLDNGCGVVFGAMRDAAYKIRRLAEKEISLHNQNRKSSSDCKKDS